MLWNEQYPFLDLDLARGATRIGIDISDALEIIVSVAEEEDMARLSIPERHRVGVAQLASLSPDAFSDFLVATEKGLHADNSSDLAAQLEKEVESLRGFPNLSEVIAAVGSMQSIFHGSHVSSEAFSTDVADALRTGAPNLAKNVDLKILRERVIKISEAKRIEIAEQKIRDIQGEVEKSYCCGRIMTDVRAAFADDPSILPTAMTIIHTLRLGYINDAGEHREFYLALDNDDLSEIQELIVRAQTKSKTLQALLAKTECRMFE